MFAGVTWIVRDVAMMFICLVSLCLWFVVEVPLGSDANNKRELLGIMIFSPSFTAQQDRNLYQLGLEVST